MIKNSSIFKLTLLFVIALSAPLQVSQAAYPASKRPEIAVVSRQDDKRISKLVSKMTLEEKAAFLCGTGMPGFDGLTPVVGEVNEGRVPGAAGATYAIDRLKIPAIVVADGPAGLRIKPTRKNDDQTYYATAFPVGTALASSWNTELIYNVGKAMGSEVKEYGVDVLLAPALNIHRNPLCGRNFEYYSEDPLIAGKTAAAMVSGVQSNGVGTSVKHFAANNQETNRLSINAHVSERAMREIYLKGFEIVVKEAHPWTVMSSYNLINGTYTSARKDLLTNILRNEWGFDGIVMTDWFGGYAGFSSLGGSSNVAAQISAGNDLLMPGMKPQKESIVAAVKAGTLSMKDIDASVTRILQLIYKTPTTRNYQYSNKPDLKAHAEITRQAAAEGMVLLKNDKGVFPIAKSNKIAAFGTTTYHFISGGTGSGDVNEAYTVSLIEGLKNVGYTLDEDLVNLYTPFVEGEVKRIAALKRGILDAPVPLSELELNNEQIEVQAKEAQVGLITIGRNSGEGSDRAVNNDFNLTDEEQILIARVADAFHAQGKAVVVILNVGGVVETASWKNKVDGILLSWQPGQEGGNSVADVLCGNVTPSGKLPMTFPMNYFDTPSATNWLGIPKTDPKEVTYVEGVYVGYRYYNTFHVQPSYEFGYGLSYTAFSYSDLKLSSTTFDGKLTVNVTVKNIGKTAGKEVAQLYLSAPAGTLDKPLAELKGFAKTPLLQPGQSETVTLTLTDSDLASFSEKESAWIAEAGQYNVAIGVSSMDIRQQASFTLPQTKIVEKVKPAFALDKNFVDLKAPKP